MSYPTLWTIGFIALFTGYLMLAGANYGVGSTLLVTARTDRERRTVLGGLGPFLLGNEAWLLVSVGILVGTLPGLKTQLLVGAAPFALTALSGALVLTSAVMLRSRHPDLAVRRRWDVAICVAGIAAAFGWGGFLTAVAGGLDIDGEGHVTGSGASLSPVSLLGGLAAVALFAAHGAAFTAARTTGESAARAARITGPLGAAGGALAAVTVLAGLAGGHFDGDALRRPWIAVFLMAAAGVALFAAHRRMSGGSPWQSFAATATAVGLLPVAVFAAKYPYLVTPSDSGTAATAVQDLAADSTSLALITWTAGPVLLLVIAVQIRMWWLFRTTEERAAAPAFH
ncbi:cytochrome d ubiquinol oxidase subunit II [Streptomyces sp. NBC_01381]|uniref:cytochrome d ubiquinol oxidase subunit II n=1 Tax=Streptomyces sp. NBC_01381 TaxID=2903845 RepID=UPI0022553E1D|nr:cytochrome d ubiquinol oxidase subunit II [Streptomyces sp. NBC_01381]MCX4667134.1 cytochrome d ubiquinol oxidase subunit II [Streptomyces sp. NBC_01381]